MPGKNEPGSPANAPATPGNVTAEAGVSGQSESTPNPETFADQPQIDVGDGPFVKFIGTSTHSHKQVSAADFALAGHKDVKGAEWNATNGFLVPASYFGEGGADNAVVKRLLQEKDEFVLVDKAE